MRHIFKKLHLGGGSHDPSRTGEGSSVASSTSSAADPTSPGLSCGSDHRRAMTPVPPPPVPTPPQPAPPPTPPPPGPDFFLTEEEFQVQLAMAISASNTEFKDDPHNDQIRAATLLSLGQHRGDAAREENCAAESLSRRYWDYNVLDYDDKIVNGFYDIFELASDSSGHGKMPTLTDLQSKGDLGFEVIVVNRTIDPPLLELEDIAQCISLDCPAAKRDLVEKIAELVTDHMGGPVKDAHGMLVRWMERSNTLRTSMQTSLLPIGGVRIGLSRHRALLFKVLADIVGIPCKLVKGSHYTGIEGDALNIIKLESEREYLVDLMAAPGTLIPADVLSTKDTPTSENPRMNENTTFSTETPLDWTEVISGMSSESELSKREHGYIGRQMERMSSGHHGMPVSGKAVITSWSDTPQCSIGSSSKGDGASFLPENQSTQLSDDNITTTNEKEVLELDMSSEIEKTFVDRNLQDNIDCTELFSELNPFQSKGIRKANGFYGRRENISSGPGRAPLPLVWKNRPACNELSRYKHNAVADGGLPRINNKGKDHNTSSNFTSISSSHVLPGNSKVLAAHTSVYTSSHGVDASYGGIKDLLTGDSFHVTNIHDQTSGTSRINLCGPSVFSSDISHAENPVLPLSSSNGMERGKRQENDKHTKENSDKKNCSHDRIRITDSSMPSVAPNKLDMLDDVAGLEILWEDLLIGERIGLGSYGEVFRADWNGTEVAVKKFLDQDFYGEAMDEFQSEIRIMRRLQHPNVVLFMGAVTRAPNLSIVTEFLPRGSLYRILHRPNCLIDEKRRIKMALDVAKGMNCLHTSIPTIVHRDLKSPNLLVDKNWNVKVCDFGLSRLKQNTFLSSKSTAGTPEWMAPEMLRNEQSNEKCDVYSFGVILWELATLRMPWSGMNAMQVVGAVGFQNRRLDIPIEVDPLVAEIICECWQQDPNLRPSFAELIEALKQLERLVVPSQLDQEDSYMSQETNINSTT